MSKNNNVRKQLQSLTDKVRSLKSAKPPVQRSNTRRRGRPGMRRRWRRFYQNVRAPISEGVVLNTYSKIIPNRDGNSARLAFAEIFTPVLGFAPDKTLTWSLAINPAKWIATRTQTQSMLYSQFRPEIIKVTYVPTCGTNTQGTMSWGFLYNSATIDSSTLHSSLPQCEGGAMTPVWQKSMTTCRCSTSLFQNYFGLSNATPQDIPMIFICSQKAVNQSEPLGYFLVSGVFRLSGPRTAPATTPFGGTISGKFVYNSETKQTEFQVDKDTVGLPNLKVGDSFDAKVSGFGGNASGGTYQTFAYWMRNLTLTCRSIGEFLTFATSLGNFLTENPSVIPSIDMVVFGKSSDNVNF